MNLKNTIVIVLLVSLIAGVGLAQITDPIPQKIQKGPVAIELQQVAVGLAAGVYLTDAGDNSGRLFVVDQAGKAWIIENGALSPTPFLDVSDRLVSPLGVLGSHNETDYDERGFLGIAFHPGYADPASPGFGKLYTYTSEPVSSAATFTTASPPPLGRVFDCQNVVAEWSVDPSNPDRVDPASRRELIRIDKPQFNHNAGMVAFGPDGLLYISTGDGGGANDADGVPFFGGLLTFGHGPTGNAQNIHTIYGKILRIDPLGNTSANGQYGIPLDNPLVNKGGLEEIYAYGFRNPFRFSFDKGTGDLVVGDVGQNNVEEIDRVIKGGNYGWRWKEGTFRFDPPDDGTISTDMSGLPAGLIDPLAEYDHDEGIAIIGGFVYRGSQIPELFGKYVFGDFTTSFSTPTGRLFYADLSTGQIREFILGANNRPLGYFVKGLGQDAARELYVLAGPDLGPFGTTGLVLKIVNLCAQNLPGDINHDCVVNLSDLAALASDWLRCVQRDPLLCPN
jgi:hypothetical protein